MRRGANELGGARGVAAQPAVFGAHVGHQGVPGEGGAVRAVPASGGGGWCVDVIPYSWWI